MMGSRLQNVVLLATAHNITGAYIKKLHSQGLQPSQVLLLNWRDSSYSNAIDGLGDKEFSVFVRNIKESLKAKGLFAGNLAQSTKSILNSVGWDYQEITIDHINEEKLITYLSNSVDETYIIFCGGGILRHPILNCGKKFIHVHPGIVPEVRGADCLLWSALVNNKIGMSAFFMDEDIDTGDIIDRCSFEVPCFDIDFSKWDPQIIKSLLIQYVDPHFRADTLVSVFEKEPDPSLWETQKQSSSEGNTYYFMHNELLPQALRKFFKSEMKMVG
jgi:hypothetical protein